MQRIVLASSSPYRQALLARLSIPFTCDPPHIDESAVAGESPEDTARRLSLAKAYAVGPRHCGTLVIASDQVGALGRTRLGKPGTREAAIRQLESMSGRSVRFLTGLCVLNMQDGRCLHAVETYTVRMRPLAAETIRDYVDREQPFDCAGSFKAEGLGIALFDYMRGDDPTTLEGLPLIRLSDFLRQMGSPVLAERSAAGPATSR